MSIYVSIVHRDTLWYLCWARRRWTQTRAQFIWPAVAIHSSTPEPPRGILERGMHTVSTGTGFHFARNL